MTRTEIIFELAKYCPSVIYKKILHWPTNELKLLLEIYRNDNDNLDTLMSLFKRLDDLFEKETVKCECRCELFEISIVPCKK